MKFTPRRAHSFPKISAIVSATTAVAAALLASACATFADVKLPAIFSDHMVLQQGIPLTVWGWADDGEAVTVKLQGQEATTTTRGTKWSVKLKPLTATATPTVLTVAGKTRVQLQDVLVGEVWICSGQSNMEWSLRQSFQPEADIAAAANPNIRLFTVPRVKADAPLADIKGSWTACNPGSAAAFSAVGYYFGRDLEKAVKVPVGLIHTSWGGSPAEVWMSNDVLAGNPDYKRNILDGYTAALERAKDAKAKFDADAAKLASEGKKPTGRPPGGPGWKPSELYNAMIAPLIPFGIRGAIWYQGESNAGRAHEYRTLYADMITNWRRDWGVGDFTFLGVQLAPFTKILPEPANSNWAELREAQWLATQKLPNVGMAVITDVGEEVDIHPRKKGPVGARLALAARTIAYHEKIVSSGPIYKSLKVDGSRALLSFDHVGSGLEAREGELKGFAVCGDDKKFVWGKAEILPDNTIAVSSPAVAKPVAVRFGWANFPVVNLWNKEGLPASPFRTDDFPMITAPKAAAK